MNESLITVNLAAFLAVTQETKYADAYVAGDPDTDRVREALANGYTLAAVIESADAAVLKRIDTVHRITELEKANGLLRHEVSMLQSALDGTMQAVGIDRTFNVMAEISKVGGGQ
jgi:hypothetical protein